VRERMATTPLNHFPSLVRPELHRCVAPSPHRTKDITAQRMAEKPMPAPTAINMYRAGFAAIELSAYVMFSSLVARRAHSRMKGGLNQ